MRKKIAIGVVLLIAFFFWIAWMPSTKNLVNSANKYFRQKKFDQALNQYKKALSKDPNSPYINYNIATTLIELGDEKSAIEYMQKALLADDKKFLAKAYYNLGSAFFKFGVSQEDADVESALAMLNKSLESFQNVLNINKKDKDAIAYKKKVEDEIERLKKRPKKKSGNSSKDGESQQSSDEKGSDKNIAGPSEDKDSSNKSLKDQESKSKDEQNVLDNKKSPDEKSGDQAEPQDPSNDAEGKADGEMTPKEAKMVLDDYQHNEEPKGMLYFVTQSAKEKPVVKDW